MLLLEFLGIIPKKAPARLRHNLAINFWEGIPFDASFVLVNFNTVLPGLALILIGRIPELKGWENRAGVLFLVMTHIGWCLMPIISSFWVHSLKVRLPLTVRVGMGLRYPWFFAGAAILLFGASHPALALGALYASVFLYAVATGLNSPLWQDMIASTVPTRLRGTLFGWRTMISMVLGLAMLNAVRPVQKAQPFPYDYALLIFITALGTSVSMFLFAKIREPRRSHTVQPLPFRTFLASVLKSFKEDSKLRRLLAFRLFQSAIFLGTSALVTVRTLKVLEVSSDRVPEVTHHMTIANFLAMGLALPLWGFLADRRGWKQVEIAAMALMAGGFLLSLLASSLPLFCAALALLGAGEVGVGLSAMSFIMEFGSPRHRPATISLHNLAYFPGAIAPLLGGALADHFGSDWVLGTAALMSVIMMALMGPFVTDPRKAPSP